MMTSAPSATGERATANPKVDVVLRASHVSVDYVGARSTHAVRDVSVELRRGEVLGIAGESGCGKSTLAYALTRLLRPPAAMIAGEVEFSGRNDAAPVDVLGLDPAALRRFRWSKVSMVFQGAMNSLNPVTTLNKQFGDIFRTHRPGMDRSARTARGRELLETVGIDANRITSYPHELSGGMRQRVGIAMALALEPEVVIMDEPTTALDVVVQREILEEIKRLQGEFGLSIIFITHDLSLLLELSDRMVVMYAGEVAEHAAAVDIGRRPAHPYSAGLLRSFPELEGDRVDLRGVPGTPPDLREETPGCPFAPRCDFAFEPCWSIHPELRAPAHLPAGETPDPGWHVACHLHDSSLRTGPIPIELTRGLPLPAGSDQ
jgi:peptide/nickel transport system ATP-binding protein